MAEPEHTEDWPTQVQDAPTTVIDDRAPVAAPATPPPADPRRRAFQDMWPWLIALGLLVLGGLVALWWFQYRDTKQQTSSTPATQPTLSATTPSPAAKVGTPKVVGLKQSAAAAELTQAGLEPLPKPVKSLAPAGTVVAQRPAAGTRVARGSKVALDVSAGKPAVAVPDVSGRLAPDAIAALRKAGFATVVVGVPSTQPKGTVVAEAPSAGTKAPAGTKVRLNISKGAPTPAGGAGTTPAATTPAPAPARTTPARTTSTPTATTPAPKPAAVTVPDLTTTPHGIFPAIRTLEQAGLHAQVTLVPSSQPAGRVISQSPTAQSKTVKGQVVQLNVSLGPNPAEPVQVPDVTGQDVQQATQALEDAGFSVQTVDRKVAGAAQDGKVVDEQPGGQAPQGFTIVLVVGRTS